LNHDRILDTGSDSEAEDDDATDKEPEKGEDASAMDTDTKKTPVKRRRRQAGADKYDVEDPFIDDSEALMEQVAAASKDGFFVYSGPLIAEGERPKIDKSSLLCVADNRAEQPKKRKAPTKKPPGEKVPRAKKVKDKDKDKTKGEDVPPVIAQ
jgi:HPC2 and ubinuclein domain